MTVYLTRHCSCHVLLLFVEVGSLCYTVHVDCSSLFVVIKNVYYQIVGKVTNLKEKISRLLVKLQIKKKKLSTSDSTYTRMIHKHQYGYWYIFCSNSRLSKCKLVGITVTVLCYRLHAVPVNWAKHKVKCIWSFVTSVVIVISHESLNPEWIAATPNMRFSYVTWLKPARSIISLNSSYKQTWDHHEVTATTDHTLCSTWAKFSFQQWVA